MRTFISIDLPEEIVLELIKIQKEIDKLRLIKGKFTECENFHLTLKFLGELSRSEIEAVKERLLRVKFEHFNVELDKLGIFSEDFIRIIWVSLKSDGLFELQKAVDEALGDLFAEEYNFMAHITIARPKFVEDKKVLIEELGKIKFKKKSFLVENIFLKESELTPQGSRYSYLLDVKCSSEIEVSA